MVLCNVASIVFESDDTNELPMNTNELPMNTNELPMNTNELPMNTNVPMNTNELPMNTNELPMNYQRSHHCSTSSSNPLDRIFATTAAGHE